MSGPGPEGQLFQHSADLYDPIYLRMKDVPLPALYGPSADEEMK